MDYIVLAPANIQRMVGSILPTGLLRPEKSGLSMTEGPDKSGNYKELSKRESSFLHN
jgi:hypothetical protein